MGLWVSPASRAMGTFRAMMWLMPLVLFASTSDLDGYDIDCATESPALNRSYPTSDVTMEFTATPIDKGTSFDTCTMYIELTMGRGRMTS